MQKVPAPDGGNLSQIKEENRSTLLRDSVHAAQEGATEENETLKGGQAPGEALLRTRSIGL